MANTYLSRTPSSASNQKTYTISAWFKLSSLTTNSQIFGAKDPARSSNDGIWVLSSGQIMFYIQGVTVRQSTQVLRDFNAWYHVVASVDTTQSTASDRLKIYLNGSQVTSFSTSADPTQNVDTAINGTNLHNVGQRINDDYFDGSMSHIHFIDGTAYAPTEFGETDATTGEWKINTSPSVTYGTNGFFILKDGNSVTDQSGNSNNFTVAGGTLTKTEDSPSNVFATLNALTKNSITTLSNGNLKHVGNNSSWSSSSSTLGVSSGKWYAEFKFSNSTGTDLNIGIHSEASIYNQQNDGDNYTGKQSTSYGYFNNGNKVNNSSSTAYGASYTNGDIVGVALDMDAGTISFYKNGVSQGTAFTGLSGTYFIGLSTYKTGEANFGNGYFGTTAVSSAGTNASGNGIFEYDVPTGFTALSTKGLNL